jgi:hypothetical protein
MFKNSSSGATADHITQRKYTLWKTNNTEISAPQKLYSKINLQHLFVYLFVFPCGFLTVAYNMCTVYVKNLRNKDK